MGVIRSMAGMVQLEIISANPASALQKIINRNILVFDVTYIDDLTVRCMLYKKDYHTVKTLLDRAGDQCRSLRRKGLYFGVTGILRRPVLTVSVALIIFAAIYLPTRIFFINVEGNSLLPTDYILEKVADCGIAFGSSRREVRSEKVKNSLIESIPELQWVGINTSGCVATISVKEKSVADREIEDSKVSSIVADRDGIIYSCTVEQGNGLCKVGQAVKEGQLLVSGYTDSGLVVTATKAKAEIFAKTQRELYAVTPDSYQERTVTTEEKVKHSLLIGKNLINFYNDSGISDATCVKMYEEDYLTLPGGFVLPVAIVTERWVSYETVSAQDHESDNYSWIQDYSDSYILHQMIAGQILHADTSLEVVDGICSFNGQYACLEIIGKNKAEEIIHSYGKNE